MKKKWFFFINMLIMFSLILLGCSQSEKTSVDVSANDITDKETKITIALKSSLTGFDSHDTNDTDSLRVQRSIYEGLLEFDKNHQVMPLLAKDYDISNDVEYTFYLREGVTFHDGTPFNAEAVKINIDRLADPDNNLVRHSLFEMVEKTEVVDEYTVKVTLKEPFGSMINNFAHNAAKMISPAALDKYGKDINFHPVGTGPFKYVDWAAESHVLVEKNEDYWRKGLPRVDKIEYKFIAEDGTRVAMLQTGEVDIISPFPSEQLSVVSDMDGVVVDSIPSLFIRQLSMNTQKKPFNDVRVRHAINHAIDKEAFIQTVLNGYGNVADGVIASNVAYYSQQLPYEFNIEKAKQLLAEAGYADGFETTIRGSNSSQNIKGMEFIQQQLAQVGILAEVLPAEYATLSDNVASIEDPRQADHDLYYDGWSPSTGDADWGLRPLFSSESIPPNGSTYNRSFYSKEEVDRLIAKGISTADPEERKAAYDEVQAIIWEDAPVIFLYNDVNHIGYRSDVHFDSELSLTNSLDVTEIEVH